MSRTTSLRGSSENSAHASVEQNGRQIRLTFRKARKLSRVFTDMSLLDSLVRRKSVDGHIADATPSRASSAAPHTLETPPMRHSEKPPSRQTSQPSLDGKMSRSTSPSSHSMEHSSTIPLVGISDAQTLVEVDLQPPIHATTLLAPQSQPHLSTQSIPLSTSRPGSSGSFHRAVLTKKRRKSLDLRQLDEFQVKTPVLLRSRSLRISSFADLAHSTSPKSLAMIPSSINIDRPLPFPKTSHNHYTEVKRARKMTQLFGQELPTELIRVLDDRRNVDSNPRSRADSTTSTEDMTESIMIAEEPFDAPGTQGSVRPVSPPTCPDFQERRRRVAKLSNFFGVNHAEIASSIVLKPNGRSPTSMENRPSISSSRADVGEVGVKVISRRRWGLGEDMKDVEIGDAITKLRGLKAS